MKLFKSLRLELVFWIVALAMLAFSDPHQHHFTLCPLANLGFEWCPGCGLGRSISALFHGNVLESLKYHWFGIPALGLIAYRIYELSKLNTKTFKLYTKED